METKVKENGAAINGEKQAVKGVAFINGNPVNKEAVKPEEAKKDGAQEQTEQPLALKDGIEQPKAEPAKPETKPEKPVLDREGTLKLVEELTAGRCKGTSCWTLSKRWKLSRWHKSKTGTRRMVTNFRVAL